MSPAASEADRDAAAGFAPIAAPGARVLVLGSLPSRQSLERQEYYGNPQNAFWRIMGELFGAGPDLPYAERSRRLAAAGVAVWDVLRAAIRPGSLDADIDIGSAMANDFDGFAASQPDLELLCFNGGAAERLFRRLVVPHSSGKIDALECVLLPSTSPAHAAMHFEQKLERWSVLKQRVLDHGRQ